MTTPRSKSSWRSIGRLEAHGLWAGLGAGISFLFAQIVVAGLTGVSIMLPFRHAASIIMKQQAFETPAIAAMALGLAIHLSASLMFGFLFGLVASDERRKTRRSTSAQLALGGGFGALLWLVNIQLIATFFYPWIVESGTALQFVLHVVAFGLPLGAIFALIRRGEAPTLELGSREVEI